MNGTAATVAIGYQARVFVCLVSMVQIIFFSETATVMLATKSPVKFWELLVCFLERTIIAIPMASIAMHLDVYKRQRRDNTIINDMESELRR